ncbi:ATP-dependent protease La Type I [hydrothermal vent metagenome]|uniref:endopeptidase La n=1 Tax=hydrothermal vent metagenome TaxID=652676 RepID=A0A3B1E5G9_9ZZZZ
MNLENYNKFPDQLPVVIEDDMFIYPFMVAPIFISDKRNIEAVNHATNNNKLLTIALSTPNNEGKRDSASFYNIGVAGKIMRKIALPDGRIKILFQGLTKVTIQNVVNKSPIIANVDSLKIQPYNKEDVQVTLNILYKNITILSNLNSKFPPDLIQTIKETSDANRVADLVSSILTFDKQDSYELYSQVDINKRLVTLIQYIKKEIDSYKLEKDINKKVNRKLEKYHKDYFLKEQMKTIQKELGTKNQKDKEIEEFREKLNKLKSVMPKLGYKEVKKQIDKLSRMHQDSGDASVLHTFIEQIFEIPFGKMANKKMNIKNVQKQLNNDHYSLQEPKDRIIEFFGVKQLLENRNIKNPQNNGAILCFIGPPGVGKTSLANSISKALKRPLVRIALGGLDDVNELRGHRRTYVGAMPGRLINGLINAKKMNPVIVLDEIDKISTNRKGDPTSVMLEILDPEQNSDFRDLYLNFSIDLSNCVFVATANNLGNIPMPLRDRMEFIEINSYTPTEKFHIAHDYIIPQELKKHGLKKSEVILSNPTIKLIIEKYTREAGVRNLRRVIARVFRKAVKNIIFNNDKRIDINSKNLEKYLDNPIFEVNLAETNNSVGIGNGLAWTSVGGDVLKIEAIKFKGKGLLQLTGNMGDVMKESARIAYSVVKSLIINKDIKINELDIHMHIPEGATPKDGPSAGAVMALTLYSLLTNTKIKSTVAMTGELTLTGKVLPIGGLKEKLIAAHKAKMKIVLIPTKNYKQDLKDIPSEVKSDITIISINNINEVLKHSLVDNLD